MLAEKEGPDRSRATRASGANPRFEQPAYGRLRHPLSARQELILCKVVEGYLRAGQPVASRAIAADPELDCGASTVRNELALLEEHGLLAHPHTSAGRVPTDAGQRYVVDRMLVSGEGLMAPARLELSLTRQEVEDAMRATTETLSQVTDLLAVVSAPSASTATIRHVEVLALQPQMVVAVIITSTGGVSKVLAAFDEPVDPGLVAWAGEYLNDRLVGLGLGARMLHQRLADQTLPATERTFLDRMIPAFGDLAAESEHVLYLDGAARLFSEAHLRDVGQINELMEFLERRVVLLSVLRTALSEPGVYVRIGRENDIPAMRSLAMVAAGYGVAQRRLGIVSVIGPVRMDYAYAIPTVREAAHELSRFVEETYAES
jgi:heat-inducible transcriptional repressor